MIAAARRRHPEAEFRVQDMRTPGSLPGGFTLDGDRDAMVCVFTDTEGIDRQTILQLGLAGVRKDAYEYGVVCTRLRARRGKRGGR